MHHQGRLQLGLFLKVLSHACICAQPCDRLPLLQSPLTLYPQHYMPRLRIRGTTVFAQPWLKCDVAGLRGL